MLTSFFGKSRPFIYFILGLFLVVAYFFSVISENELIFTPSEVFFHLFICFLCVLSMLVLNFIIQKNQLTKNNTYAVFIFSSFIAMLPAIFLENKFIITNLLLLFALRRVMSLRTERNSSKKIFDASLWITLASLFYFWSLLFFVPLLIAIVQKPNTDYKQLLMPLAGFFAVLVLNTAFQLLATDSATWFLNWKQAMSFDFSAYSAASVLIPVSVILTFYIWMGINKIAKISAMPLKERPNQLLLFYVGITAFVIALATPTKTGAEILFVLAPIAIVTANYIEPGEQVRYREKDVLEIWFKEIMLWMIAILPFLFLLV